MEGRALKHTLVAVFSDEDELKIRAMLDAAGAEDALKIPFGRGCDSKKADAAMRYHITVAHSSRETDAVFMERIGNFRFPGQCRAYVTGTGLMPGKRTILSLKYCPLPGSFLFRGIQGYVRRDRTGFGKRVSRASSYYSGGEQRSGSDQKDQRVPGQRRPLSL